MCLRAERAGPVKYDFVTGWLHRQFCLPSRECKPPGGTATKFRPLCKLKSFAHTQGYYREGGKREGERLCTNKTTE